MRTQHLILVGLASLLVLQAHGAGTAAREPVKEPVKVVYHVNGGLEEATHALRSIRNHLKVEPGVKIVVVAQAAGVDFLLEGAQDKHKYPYNVLVEELAAEGVEFRVCNFTLQTRKLDPSKVLPEAKVVPSGVAEIARLQFREGFAYIHP